MHEQRGLGVQVQGGTYKLMYERGREDVLVRRRSAGEQGMLSARAAAREEERRRRGGRLFEK